MAEEAGILRSAQQSRVQLYIPYETAHDTVKALGEVGLFQPEDLSKEWTFETAKRARSTIED